MADIPDEDIEADPAATEEEEEPEIPKIIKSELNDIVTWWPMFLDAVLDSNIQLAIRFGKDGKEALLINEKDEMFGAGSNAIGCLGVGDQTQRTELTKNEELSGKQVTSIVAGGGPHVMALTKDGKVFAWGHNENHQLGDGDKTSRYSPQLCTGLEKYKVTEIACGHIHSLALTDNSKVFGWGYNNYGQIGCGNTTAQAVPIQIEKFRMVNQPVERIACSSYSSFALTAGRKIYSWGRNDYGQLGAGNTNQQLIPKTVKSAEKKKLYFKHIACGVDHILSISDDNSLFAWGLNSCGQTGNGTKDNVCTPTEISIADLTIEEVGASIHSHLSVARTTNNIVFAWGDFKGTPVLKPKKSKYSSLNEAFLALSTVPVTCWPMAWKEQEDQDSVTKCLWRSFTAEETSDCEFNVEGKTICGHISFLKMRSAYLNKLLDNHWCKSQEEIKIQGYSYDVFYAYLRYLYTDELIVQPGDAMDLLHLADEYLDSTLKEKCEKFIIKGINIENVFSTYEKARMHKAKKLEECCFRYAVVHLTKATKTEAFSQLNEELSHEFFRKAAEAGAFKY